jgi:hypothetical protein
MRGSNLIFLILFTLFGISSNCTEKPYFVSFGKNIDYFSNKNTYQLSNQREWFNRTKFILPVFQSCIGLKSQSSKVAVGFWFSPFNFQNQLSVEFKNNVTFSRVNYSLISPENWGGAIFSADFLVKDRLSWNFNTRIQLNDKFRQTNSKSSLYNLSTGINYSFSENLIGGLSYGYTPKGNSGIFTLGVCYNISFNFIGNSTTIQPNKTYQF